MGELSLLNQHRANQRKEKRYEATNKSKQIAFPYYSIARSIASVQREMSNRSTAGKEEDPRPGQEGQDERIGLCPLQQRVIRSIHVPIRCL